jgi:hypothetical protein
MKSMLEHFQENDSKAEREELEVYETLIFGRSRARCKNFRSKCKCVG